MYSDVRGKLFEVIAHRKLASGDKFISRNLESGVLTCLSKTHACSLRSPHSLLHVIF